MHDSGPHFTAGAAAGFIGGAVMILVAMTHAAAVGMSFWLPVQLIAAALYGLHALLGGMGVAVIGMFIHLVLSAFFGGVVGLLVARTTTRRALVVGLGAGVVLWVVMTFLVLPVTNVIMRERIALMPGWWFFYHVVFGASLGLTPWLNRVLGSGGGGAMDNSDLHRA